MSRVPPLCSPGRQTRSQNVWRRRQANKPKPGRPQRLALVDETHVINYHRPGRQVLQQVADPDLLIERPCHVRAEQLCPPPRVTLGGEYPGGLGRKTSLEHYPPRKQLGRPPQEVLVPLVAVLRALGDDAL